VSPCLPVNMFSSRLYAILDTDLLAARGLAPLDVCEVWLAGGIDLIQLRAKGMASGPMLTLAEALLERTRAAGARLIINDRADIAAVCGADGVHVGQDDLAPEDVRRLVGDDAIVGVSTHTDAQVEIAVTKRVSYVAVGPVFGTSTKATGYDAVGLDFMQRASLVVHAAGLPLVAIGGIDATRASSVLRAGADAVAVISDLVGNTLRQTMVRVEAWREGIEELR
jgi:thiamine-phosphate pyrophosphorylase